jgi:hypothetical protein
MSNYTSVNAQTSAICATWSPAERRLAAIGSALLALALLGAVGGSYLLGALGLPLNAHGHTHLYAHGHPFIDARIVCNIPNALDVLSNLPFAVFGAWGLWLVRRAPLSASTSASALPQPARQAAQVFFIGLLLTCAGSGYYHWAPDAVGLAIDRAGMAVAFAGVLGLAAAERVSQRATPWVWRTMLVAAALAIPLQTATGNITAWAVVQFGGIAVVLWAATQRALPSAWGIRWGIVIALYVVAKLLELGDAAVFHATGELVSGHSLKHIAASLAALPILQALRHNGCATGALSPHAVHSHNN